MKIGVRLISTEDEKNILKLFFRTELERGEKIIDNSDKYISDKLGLKLQWVSSFIACHLEYKFNKLYQDSLTK